MSHRKHAFRFSLVLATLIAAWISPLHAQSTYPSRPVRIIVPFAAGTSPDVVMRIVSPKLSESLGQPVIIDNRAGAASNLGTGLAAAAAPDGHTLLYTIHSTICAGPHLYSNLQFDPFKSFAPVSLVVNLGFVLIAKRDLPVQNLQELIAFAKAQPGRLTYGSGGSGSGNHLVMELLNGMAGVSMLHIPMRTNSTNAVMSGETDLTMSPYTNGVGVAKGGKVRALGVTLAKRAEALPDVPAIGEVVNGFVGDSWHGLFAPAGTPTAIVDKVSAEVAKALATPDVRKRLTDISLEPVGSTPAEFAAIVKSDYDKWGKVIRAANIRLD
jgi:tripartite-type tricarboxylate transporter receptor subunit TctC